MNTIGKILVVCVVLMSLATAGFLVVDFATRQNWHKAYEELKREITVREASSKTFQDTVAKLNNDYKKVVTDLDVANMKIIEKDQIHKAEISGHQIELDAEKIRTKEAELTVQRSLAEIDRLK